MRELTKEQQEWLDHARAFLSINSGREGASSCASLARLGLVERLSRGTYRITDAGRAALQGGKQ